jgi:exopolysaccharide biosynthesis polyprenyl glycosylphosphotransferase
MLKELKQPLAIVFWIMDLLVVVLSYYALSYIHYGELNFHFMTITDSYGLSLWGNIFSWVYVSNYFQLNASKRLVTFGDELMDVFKAAGIAVTLAAIPPVFYKPLSENVQFFVRLFLVQFLSLITIRALVRMMFKYIRARGYNFRQVLIVGRNDRAAKLARRIELYPELGLRILGFIDAPNGECRQHCDYPFNVVGTLADCERIVRECVVDEIFITLPIKSFYSEIERIIKFCETVGIEAKIPTDIFPLRSSKTTVSRYLDVAVIDLYTSPKMTLELIIKRIMDVTISLVLTLLLLPIFLIISILIKVGSEGPILFRQQRVGYNGRTFTLFKFRTMVKDAEKLKDTLRDRNEMDGPVFKMKDDPRVTSIGAILRRTSLDELPQLFNVLKGDMSLVGPRPPVPPEVAQYALPDRRRLSMKPGITGIWQVSGRNNIPFSRWMEMDREYIDQWSLWLDLKILFRTIPVVLKREGAS